MKIKLTSVYVDDQETALRFYTEVLVDALLGHKVEDVVSDSLFLLRRKRPVGLAEDDFGDGSAGVGLEFHAVVRQTFEIELSSPGRDQLIFRLAGNGQRQRLVAAQSDLDLNARELIHS